MNKMKFIAALVCCAFVLSACSSQIKRKTVVVDAGHGGKFEGVRFDITKKAGYKKVKKVLTVNGETKTQVMEVPIYKEIRAIKEQNLNLLLAKEVQKLLANDKRFKVIMTRENDKELDTTVPADLKKRMWIAQENNADAFVSLHVNSIGSDWSKSCEKRGFEVFFRNSKYLDDSDGYVGNTQNIYNASKDQLSKMRSDDKEAQKKARDEGSSLAWNIVSKFKTMLKLPPHNEGLSEDKRNLYILKTARIPAVIIEAGYLCNDADRPLLEDKNERKRMAKAIYDGIVAYGESAGWFSK